MVYINTPQSLVHFYGEVVFCNNQQPSRKIHIPYIQQEEIEEKTPLEAISQFNRIAKKVFMLPLLIIVLIVTILVFTVFTRILL